MVAKKRVKSYSEEELEFWREVKRENSKKVTKKTVKKPVKKITKKSVNKSVPASKTRDTLVKKASNLSNPKGVKTKDIIIPIHYSKGLPNMPRAYRDWEEVIVVLRINPRVFASNTLLYYEHNDTIQAYPLSSAKIAPKRKELEEGYKDIVDKYLVKVASDLKLISLVVHVIFKSSYVKRK